MNYCATKNLYRLPAIPDCLTTLKIKTTLVSATVDDKKVLNLVSPTGKAYVLRKATDTGGVITLTLRGETADLPFKLLNPFAGSFRLFVDGFSFKDCAGKNYPGVVFSVADTLDSLTEYTIDLTDCGSGNQKDYSSADYSNEFSI